MRSIDNTCRSWVPLVCCPRKLCTYRIHAGRRTVFTASLQWFEPVRTVMNISTLGDFPVAPGLTVGRNKPCFIIAEVGQNHQGDINIAKQLINASKESGANCVKFQKSCLTEKFNITALKRPYGGTHSWGKTYGQHKQYLEFSIEEFKELQNYAKSLGIIFSASAMDSVSVDVLDEMDVPFIKIGSGDANNFPLLEYAASKKRPLIISTGMQDMSTVREIYRVMKEARAKFALLHCVSSYPAPFEEINLEVIHFYKSEFPDIPIGYSGHELGIVISLGAVAMGARILERHITLNKKWKGSDHCCSLLPHEFSQMVADVRLLESAIGMSRKKRQPSELQCYLKLGKTIVASRNLKRGKSLSQDDLKIKVAEPKGYPAEALKYIIGKSLNRDIKEDESINENDVFNTD